MAVFYGKLPQLGQPDNQLGQLSSISLILCLGATVQTPGVMMYIFLYEMYLYGI